IEMDAQRALLDALMGSSRDLTEEEKKEHREVAWDDPDVCAPYMARFCPHDLFINTKSNLGVCPKIHDPALKQSFESSPRYAAALPKFEADLAHRCERLVQDLDKKIRRGRDRLAQDVVEVPPPAAHAEKVEQLAILEEKIKKLLEQIEQLGDTGKIDEATALMRKVDILNLEKSALTHQIETKLSMVPQEKKMELCEQCGSFLVTNDVLERTQSHVTGKQHIGYGLVREFLAEYKAAKEAEKLAREKEAEERLNRERGHHNRGHRDDYRERSREHDRDRYYERSRDRERPYEHGGRGSDYRGGSYNSRRDSERARPRDRNGGDFSRRGDPGRVRSRSRSPGRHGY
uniref:Uncharacterized protein n=4 Tax=Aegilops tauschii subsp. strangulata TaxID=200361 RepID=A0A453MMQ3_AEGTS